MIYEINETTKTIIIKDRVSLKDIIEFAKKHKFKLSEWELISDTMGGYTITTYPYQYNDPFFADQFTITTNNN
jgi:hypothetical protein